MKKIAILTGTEKQSGGVETITYILKEIFEKNNNIVDIIATDNFQKYTSNKKIKIRFYWKILEKIFGKAILNYKILKYIELDNYDVLICNGEFSIGVNHKNIINLFHGSFYGYSKYLKKGISMRLRLKLYLGAKLQKIGSRGKRVIAVSDFIKQILEEQGIKVNKVIYNSAYILPNISSLEKINNRKNYIMIGSFAAEGYAKGFDIIQKLIEKYKLKITCISNEKIKFTENSYLWLTREKMLEVLNEHRILIFPSRYEACQMLPIEAMSLGIPVVISSVGIGKKLSREISEFVVENLDPEEYYIKIMNIESRYEYYSKLAKNYIAQNFSIEKFEEEWIREIGE